MKSIHLNRALTLETPVDTPDGAGGFTRSWQALGMLWANIVPRTGRARDGGEVSVAQTRYRITLRAAPVEAAQRPRPEQRFREGARVFLIEAVLESDDSGRYLTCFATEEQAS